MRERLDKLIVELGLAQSRDRAQALIMEGKVLVNGTPAAKPGLQVDDTACVEIRGNDMPYVSRGGLKLQSALDAFAVTVNGIVAMDVGASTGGFTDCLLQRGAVKVYCIDVGYGQLAWKLRNDPKVVVLERTNIRFLERDSLADEVNLAVIDVSFISLLKVVPKILEFLSGRGSIIALIKPQFEVGKGQVGKGGIVRDEARRFAAVEQVKAGLESLGLTTVGLIESPLVGQKGNVEYLICLRRQ